MPDDHSELEDGADGTHGDGELSNAQKQARAIKTAHRKALQDTESQKLINAGRAQ